MTEFDVEHRAEATMSEERGTLEIDPDLYEAILAMMNVGVGWHNMSGMIFSFKRVGINGVYCDVRVMSEQGRVFLEIIWSFYRGSMKIRQYDFEPTSCLYNGKIYTLEFKRYE